MALKNQWKTIKENWVIAVILLLVVMVPLFSGSGVSSFSKSVGYGIPMMETSEMAMASDSFRGGGVYYGNNDFAPEIEDRKITKTSSISTEVERGEFHNTELKIRAIVEGTNSYLLNENSYKNGRNKNSYYSGNYQIKVPTKKYSLAIDQLKALGEVQSFNENARDITGSYTNTQTELEVEKARLERYEEMYRKATEISDQIELNDRIFNQERTIKYLEQSLENKDLQVEYTTISLNVQEEQSGYINVALVKFSELIEKLVDSFNSLLALIFWILPWAIIAIIVWFGVRFVRKRY
ncbi:MAG: DUF4349 domain-containing protein [Nanoarchaeota archaeon]|nr:DUF4349 domain-containing protein [Nanoarchaeota archaeon]MBU1623247.1 DUF4349 domain-containing protein [Nanoarchaeota archaeon]MBU1974448.1 DUF4349 domain-containing protein [Nanoarchaeota archaeon]